MGDGHTGGVAEGVDDTVVGVSSFTAQGQVVVFGIEGEVPLLELPDVLGGLGDDALSDVGVGQATAGVEGVLEVGVDGVVRFEDGGDAALGVVGVAFGGFFLGEQDDLAGRRRLDGAAEACDAGADDEGVGKEVSEGAGVESGEKASGVDGSTHGQGHFSYSTSGVGEPTGVIVYAKRRRQASCSTRVISYPSTITSRYQNRKCFQKRLLRNNLFASCKNRAKDKAQKIVPE